MGFSVYRQRGSHITTIRQEPTNQVTVPNHKEIAKSTLRAIIRQVCLSVEEFIALL
ncbi:addiction module toxin, HicA family [Scytonema sp. UIC 10036]|uniref:type II toxin-antitoxin system HicA family toxin n=1 Tax=Scytonema sp. UIC 10036 TaxID=2304196 RepID=UPI00138513A9|nr:addiction module toxin, HicA family [Scytonema sp. UIC 10036]